MNPTETNLERLLRQQHQDDNGMEQEEAVDRINIDVDGILRQCGLRIPSSTTAEQPPKQSCVPSSSQLVVPTKLKTAELVVAEITKTAEAPEGQEISGATQSSLTTQSNFIETEIEKEEHPKNYHVAQDSESAGLPEVPSHASPTKIDNKQHILEKVVGTGGSISQPSTNGSDESNKVSEELRIPGSLEVSCVPSSSLQTKSTFLQDSTINEPQTIGEANTSQQILHELCKEGVVEQPSNVSNSEVAELGKLDSPIVTPPTIKPVSSRRALKRTSAPSSERNSSAPKRQQSESSKNNANNRTHETLEETVQPSVQKNRDLVSAKVDASQKLERQPDTDDNENKTSETESPARSEGRNLRSNKVETEEKVDLKFPIRCLQAEQLEKRLELQFSSDLELWKQLLKQSSYDLSSFSEDYCIEQRENVNHSCNNLNDNQNFQAIIEWELWKKQIEHSKPLRKVTKAKLSEEDEMKLFPLLRHYAIEKPEKLDLAFSTTANLCKKNESAIKLNFKSYMEMMDEIEENADTSSETGAVTSASSRNSQE
ncbi:unnamed protein product [Caenorhabditis brenneri]